MFFGDLEKSIFRKFADIKHGKMNISGIIPARYASTRFPGKPLALIGGKPMIRLVYERVAEILGSVYVATDDMRIADVVDSFGGRALMTSADHRSGTDRCAEALDIISEEQGEAPDVILNIQGDEPFIRREQIITLAASFDDPQVQIATLIREIESEDELLDPNRPKVVMAANGDALIFSRSPVPYLRDTEKGEWAINHKFYRHLGIYGYRAEVLREICQLPQAPPELAESLEQLRWLYNGYRIRCQLTPFDTPGIDTPEDLIKAESYLLSK